jgi:hypothetical protein
MKPTSIKLLFIFLFSCNLVNDDIRIDENTVAGENSFISSNQSNETQTNSQFWKIVLFVDDGFDFTKNFEKVKFRFDESGTLEAIANEININGTWRLERDRPLDELYIIFPSNSILSELNDDWYIRERGENLLALEYKEKNYTDQLIFVRENSQATINPPFNEGKSEMVNLFNTLNNSNFKITSLIDDDDNKTFLFNGGTLKFDHFGHLELILPGNNVWKGTWLTGFNDKAVKLDIDLDYSGIPDYLDEEWLLDGNKNGVLNFFENDSKPEDFLEITIK